MIGLLLLRRITVQFFGRFKLNWENVLPAAFATDVVGDYDSIEPWASDRRYEVTWLGWSISWTRKVDRPVGPPASIEPWEWVDRILHVFRRGF